MFFYLIPTEGALAVATALGSPQNGFRQIE